MLLWKESEIYIAEKQHKARCWFTLFVLICFLLLSTWTHAMCIWIVESLFIPCKILSPQKRVPSERCAELTIIAATHGLKEAWISYQVKALILAIYICLNTLPFSTLCLHRFCVFHTVNLLNTCFWLPSRFICSLFMLLAHPRYFLFLLEKWMSIVCCVKNIVLTMCYFDSVWLCSYNPLYNCNWHDDNGSLSICNIIGIQV